MILRRNRAGIGGRLFRRLHLLLLFTMGTVMVSCSDDDAAPEIKAPTDLQVTIDIATTGVVTVNAAAKDANYYRFKFDSDVDFVREDTGIASYSYSESGEYAITVRAHATSDVFIEEIRIIEINISQSIDNQGYTTPESYAGYTLVWQDEFEGDAISNDWTYEIGTGSNGWGNNELQYYREENTTVEDGYLIITAKKENFNGRNYTSSRIITENQKEFQYGRVDIRALLPRGQGIWPALWMLGANFRSVGWPACGEIDIMEMIGGNGRENTVHGTVHWSNNGNYASYGDNYTMSSGTFNEEFHVFTIIWDSNSIRWYVDDNLYNTIDITPAELSEFRQEFFFIFNVAVGGNWPGSPDNTTIFPQRMIVDYIRVFQPN